MSSAPHHGIPTTMNRPVPVQHPGPPLTPSRTPSRRLAHARWALALLAGSVTALPALAQSVETTSREGPRPVPAQPAPQAPAVAPEKGPEAAPGIPQAPRPAAPDLSKSFPASAFLATQIERIAVMDLRASATPQAADYGVATLLCEFAARYAPQNVQLVRRRAEAAWNWGDPAELDAATQRLVELDRNDTLAQLRLLSARFANIQVVEEKLAAFDRAAESERLDPAIRSRFFLDGALLCREQGDDAGFVRRLTRATQLDSTNKDAAVLALSFFEERSDDPWGRLDLLTNLLLADPLDPQVHSLLMREMASGGAFDASRRFMRNMAELVTQGGLELSADHRIEATILDVLSQGPQEIYRDYNLQIAQARENLANQLKTLEEANQPTEGLPRPEDIRLDLDREHIRTLCAVMMGDVPGAAASMRELALTVQETIRALKDPLERPEGMTDEDAQKLSRLALLRLQLWRAATGIDADKIEADLPAATDGLPDNEVLGCALRAMLAARAGDSARVPEILAAAERDDAWLDIAEGLAHQQAGKVTEAIASLRRAQRDNPLSPQGALAGALADRLHTAHSIPLPADQAATKRRLADHAAGIDRWVDQMVRNPRSFQHLSVRLDAASAGPLQPVSATISLKNVSPRPLGLGSGRPINSRLLIAQSAGAGGRNVNNLASAEVMDAQRRLRLLPGEAVELRYSMDDGPTGWILETLCGAPSELRLRIVQGFEIKEGGVREPGPGCLETMSSSLQRTPLPEARLEPAELAALITKSDEAAFPKLLLSARAALVLRPAAECSAIIEAISRRYPGLSAGSRNLVIAVLPPATEISALQPVDAAIELEKDQEVLALALVTRATTPESPLLAAALASTDTVVTRLAELHKARLVPDAKLYAARGTGLVTSLRALYGIPTEDPARGEAPGQAPGQLPPGEGEPEAAIPAPELPPR